MTEEIPKRNKDDYGFPGSYEVALPDGGEQIVPEGKEYDFPDAYLDRIEEYGTNTPKGSIVQGALYDWLRRDTRVSDKNAMQVSRFLNNGELDEARELVDEVLEE